MIGHLATSVNVLDRWSHLIINLSHFLQLLVLMVSLLSLGSRSRLGSFLLFFWWEHPNFGMGRCWQCFIVWLSNLAVSLGAVRIVLSWYQFKLFFSICLEFFSSKWINSVFSLAAGISKIWKNVLIECQGMWGTSVYHEVWIRNLALRSFRSWPAEFSLASQC